MRACVFVLLLCTVAWAYPQRSTQYQQNEPDNQPFIEEVVVESVLHVRSAEPGRQARTDLQASLRDGSRVSQPKGN